MTNHARTTYQTTVTRRRASMCTLAILLLCAACSSDKGSADEANATSTPEEPPATQPVHEDHAAHEEQAAHEGHEGHAGHEGHEGHEEMAAAEPLPGMSLYRLEEPWTSQAGESVQLSSFRGEPVVALMFFGSCQHACPMLISDLRRLEAALSDDARARTQFVLVTIDPERDTPEAMARLATGYEVDQTRWTFLHGESAQIREIAAVLGVQYRAQSDGQFSHTNMITLLDESGVVALSVEGLGQPIDAMAARIEAMVGAP